MCFLLTAVKAFIERLLCMQCHINSDKYSSLMWGGGATEKRVLVENYNICSALKNAFSNENKKEACPKENRSALNLHNPKQWFAASFSNICLFKLLCHSAHS